MEHNNKNFQTKYLNLKCVVFLYLISLLFAVFCAPIVMKFVSILATHYDVNFCQYILKKGIAKAFDRIRLMPLIIGLYCVIKHCSNDILKSIYLDKKNLKIFFRLFLVSFFLVLVLTFAHIIVWEFAIDYDYTRIVVLIVVKSLISSIVIAFLEEIIFRKILQDIFCKQFGNIIGVVLLSLFFAYLHAKIPNKVTIDGISFACSLQCAYWMLFGAFIYFKPIVFFNIFLFGCLMSIFALKTKSLIQSISVHAGIVSFLMISRKLLCVTSSNEFFFGGTSVIGSVVSSVFLILFLIFILRKKQSNV